MRKKRKRLLSVQLHLEKIQKGTYFHFGPLGILGLFSHLEHGQFRSEVDTIKGYANITWASNNPKPLFKGIRDILIKHSLDCAAIVVWEGKTGWKDPKGYKVLHHFNPTIKLDKL